MSTGPGDLSLLDIFSGSDPQPTPAVASQQTSLVAYDKAGLKVTFHCTKQPDGSTSITAQFCNGLDTPMINFVFEAAVPKYVRLVLQEASAQVLPPRCDQVQQKMSVVNSSNGEKPLLMKLRIHYMLNGASVQEAAQVGNFPPGF